MGMENTQLGWLTCVQFMMVGCWSYLHISTVTHLHIIHAYFLNSATLWPRCRNKLRECSRFNIRCVSMKWKLLYSWWHFYWNVLLAAAESCLAIEYWIKIKNSSGPLLRLICGATRNGWFRCRGQEIVYWLILNWTMSHVRLSIFSFSSIPYFIF